MSRAIILVLDSLGIGSAPDASRYGDEGADTFGHIALACAESARGPLQIPNLTRLGLPQAHAAHRGAPAAGFAELPAATALFGFASERSVGKDTPSGHWEMAGVPVMTEWGMFLDREHSFPDSLLAELIREAALPGVLGNCHASGTEIIQRLGAEHLASGKPIVYTSADSVFQIAAHETAFGLERLYALCKIARRLVDRYQVGRVIARPFLGTVEHGFERTGNRHDYTVPPPAPTLLDAVVASGAEVTGIGKISDIFAARGISRSLPANGNQALFDRTLEATAAATEGSLVMTNFVDFDTLYGHRRDVLGYAAAIEAFDRRLPELLGLLRPGDLLAMTADHGCDPTWPGSDHTRECVPVLVHGPGLASGPIGARDSFADLGASIASHLGLPALAQGRSFLQAGVRDPNRSEIS